MRRLTFIFLIMLTLLSGCATPGYLTGSVHTAYYEEPIGRKDFFLMLPDTLSLRDKQIGELVERKIMQRGYKKAASRNSANIAVLIKYSIGQGQTTISSSPDFVFGGKNVESDTSYPRFFQLVIVDIEKTRSRGSISPVWQGEVYSEGSSQNMLLLAEHFLDALFENYGTTVNGKPFVRLGVF